ncbi:hypothetical protein QAD02_001652 [Eretmocerus hayati]|uniref:Uncharacterized protein n=1 Tax=Eretmocerus hayati TaxID=131215 RepID=A0ACC2NHL6_9HYME|nr:hypothetical protein QAD02_001652 [Eretmocerus hayati]
MVNKLWCRELARKWYQSSWEPPHPRSLSEPRCEDRVRLWYLLYRYFMLALWLTIVICSVFEIGSSQPTSTGQLIKWPIYLTNWDLSFGLAQALLGAYLVMRRWRLQRSDPTFEPSSGLSYGRSERFYWFCYVITSSLALSVSGTYWALVHDPRIHRIDALNLMVHVGNSLLIVTDTLVTRVPMVMGNFWWCPVVVTGYLTFNYVYYALGGLDKRGFHYIYSVIDWDRPARALAYCSLGLSSLVVAHCLMYFVASMRDRNFRRHEDKLTERKTENCV